MQQVPVAGPKNVIYGKRARRLYAVVRYRVVTASGTSLSSPTGSRRLERAYVLVNYIIIIIIVIVRVYLRRYRVFRN